MHRDAKYILINEDEIKGIVSDLAEQINRDFGDEPLLAVVILKGSMFFAADLIRQLKMPVTVDFMKVSSYGSASKSSGNINIQLDIGQGCADKNVLIIEDIIDSGNTLFKLKEIFAVRETKSVKLCAMLDKPDRREADINPDYTGRQIPDEFVIGYGLDYAEKYRELPYIAVLDEKVYM